MSAPAKLPAVRLPSVLPNHGVDSESLGQDPVVVELPPSDKFSFAWPSGLVPTVPPPMLSERPTSLSSSDPESNLSGSDYNIDEGRGGAEATGNGAGKRIRNEESDESDFTNRLYTEQNPMDQVGPPPSIPRLSRAFSVPLSSQISYLKNPRRAISQLGACTTTPVVPMSSELAQFRDLSLELADHVQMIIQTLLHLSPPQVFDPAKEQFSACSLPIPTPSITAMFTSMKNLNYMSANMAAFTMSSSPSQSTDAGTPSPDTPSSSRPVVSRDNTTHDFDIAETLQSVGDALSGLAADAGVDLVLFHGDVGMKHIAVKGDESGISYTLSHIVRQIIATAHRGDSVEIGLFIVAPLSEADVPIGATDPTSSTPSSFDPNVPLMCTVTIAHVFTPPSSPTLPSFNSSHQSPPVRSDPSLRSNILLHLLRHIDASFVPELLLTSTTGRSCKLSLTLERGSPAVVNPAVILPQDDSVFQLLPGLNITGEPTLEELAQFVDTLKGKKTVLYASSKGQFAQHLTSYLTAWGLDVSHVSPESEGEGVLEDNEKPPSSQPLVDITPAVTEMSFGTGSVLETLPEQTTAPTSIPLSDVASGPQSPSFILIDDDVSMLRARLRSMQSEQQYPLHLGPRKRPSLSTHHRPRSSPQVIRAMGLNAPMPPPRNTSVIIHFTSLSNFKLVKGILQTMLAPNGSLVSRMPEVIVIPKPAGPRRVLTALHTAVTRPIVDPFFSPIATSPMSPGLQSPASFFPHTSSPKSPVIRPSGSPRSNTLDRPLRSPKEPAVDGSSVAPPSPLGLSEGLDYFSEAAVKLGTSPSSGLVIQSPDGQPAGIFFHPRPKTRPSRNGGMGAEKTQSFSLGDRSYRRPADTEEANKARYQFLTPSPGTAGPSRRSPKSVAAVDIGLPDGQEGTSSAARKGMSPMPQPASSNPDAPRTEEGITSPVLPPSPMLPPSTTEVSRPQQGPRVITARKGSTAETLRKTVSPPSTPHNVVPSGASPAIRKGSARRPTIEGKPSSQPGATKGKPGEQNIVPPISVLVVDDNPINQTILSTFMKKKRIKYDVAKNGEEAVHKWKSGRFHLILMDIQMPVMDGITATKEIRRLEKANAFQGYPTTPPSDGQHTPSDAPSTESRISTNSPYRSSVIIVALTASSLQSDRVAALAAGCNDFLTKPVSLVWLNSKIIEWGSIKALQMWADIRPEAVKTISTGQTVQAQNVARRLHVPEGRASPSASPRLSSSQPTAPATATTSTPGLSALVPGKSGNRPLPLIAESSTVDSPILTTSEEAPIAPCTPGDAAPLPKPRPSVGSYPGIQPAASGSSTVPPHDSGENTTHHTRGDALSVDLATARHIEEEGEEIADAPVEKSSSKTSSTEGNIQPEPPQ